MKEQKTKKLRELAAEVWPGYGPTPSERRQSGKYLLVGGRNIKDGQLIRTSKDTYVNDLDKESMRRAIARPGDIIVSTLFDARKLYVYQRKDPKAVVNNSCAIVRAPDNNDYIVSYLRTIAGREEFLGKAAALTKGATIPRLTVHDLKEIEIPLLPISDLQQVGDAHIRNLSNDDLIRLRDKLESKIRAAEETLGLSFDEILGTSTHAHVADKTLVAEDIEYKVKELRLKEKELHRRENELQRQEAFLQDRIERLNSQITGNTLKDQIAHGETLNLEFKPSIGWNSRRGGQDSNIEADVLKTIVAFCNTEGGELLIGVGNHGEILGISGDPRFPNSDKFLLHLGNMIEGKIVPSVVPYVRYEIVSIDGTDICRVTCSRSNQDIWLKENRSVNEMFYVRQGPQSRALEPRNAFGYIRERFRDTQD